MNGRYGVTRGWVSVAIAAALWLSTPASVLAQAPGAVTVTIDPNRPQDGRVVSYTMFVRAQVVSTNELASVVATMAGRSLPLTFVPLSVSNPFGDAWEGTMETRDCPTGR